MAKPKVTLFVDTVSPFAYLAFYALENFPIFKQCEVNYVPILLGGLMKTCGNTAPLYIKNKDKWINIERVRWARQFNIPMTEKMPDGFPPNTVYASLTNLTYATDVQRALTALTIQHPDKLSAALSGLYQAFWVERQPIQKPEVFVPILSSVLGEETARAVAEASSKAEAKDELVKNTELAFSEGAFGLPWFVATNSKGEKEGFWGFDHLGQVIDHLGLERPSSGGWKAML